MGLTYLLDANTLSNPAKQKPSPLVMQKLKTHRGEIATAATALHEMVYGYERLPEGKKRVRIAEYLEAARWHAQERARLEKIGQRPQFEDGQIAAVAHVHGLILVTDNSADFRRFKGLKLENWLR